MMKNLLVISLLLSVSSVNAQTPPTQREQIIQQTNEQLNNYFNACAYDMHRIFTHYNKKTSTTEKWQFCNKNNIKIMRITSSLKRKDGVSTEHSTEIYYIKNNKLIYAKEAIVEYYKEGKSIWNCEYYTKNGKILATMSLGHGKTESDDWQPEEIFTMYKNRLQQAQKVFGGEFKEIIDN